jgi:tetratricopeptide (TPR) repeat protein
VFDEEVRLQRERTDLPMIPADDVELWRKLNGWPSFDGSDYSRDLVTNLRLFDLAVTMNKGCYPGQETVSKIATRRGAAFSPVLVETNEKISTGPLLISDNKIGTAQESLSWNNKFYSPANIVRDFRVEGMKINFLSEGKSVQGIIRYYPLLNGSKAEKALELYDSGLSYFRSDDLFHAEKDLVLALKFNPNFADAYEALGVMLGRQGRFQEAISLMEKLTEVDPDSTMAHTNLSLFLMKTGKIEEAENHKSLATMKSFKKFGDEAREKDASALKAKAELEEWARRERMFREVLEIDPEDTLANYGLGSIAVEKEDWPVAKAFLETVLKADPKYSVAYLALGKAYKGLGQYEVAKKTFADGIKVAASKGDFMPANQMQSELDRL